jgi:hypothetical protein
LHEEVATKEFHDERALVAMDGARIREDMQLPIPEWQELANHCERIFG